MLTSVFRVDAQYGAFRGTPKPGAPLVPSHGGGFLLQATYKDNAGPPAAERRLPTESCTLQPAVLEYDVALTNTSIVLRYPHDWRLDRHVVDHELWGGRQRSWSKLFAVLFPAVHVVCDEELRRPTSASYYIHCGHIPY
jgi:hypothetical protein